MARPIEGALVVSSAVEGHPADISFALSRWLLAAGGGVASCGLVVVGSGLTIPFRAGLAVDGQGE